jgi:signal transduction histidine kinase
MVRVASTLAIVGAAIATVALIGAFGGVPRLDAWIPGRIGMKVYAALSLIFVGIGIVGFRSQGARIGCGLLATSIALLTLGEYATGARHGLDAVFEHELTSANNPFPGRMAIHTAAAIGLLGIGLVSWNASRGRLREICALGAALVAYLALVGHAYGAQSLWIVAQTHMALNTSLALLALGLAMTMAPPLGGLMRELTRPHEGGFVARRLLPLVFCIPVLIGWLRLLGERAGRFDTTEGATLLVVANAAIFAVATFWAARIANRVAAERETARTALAEARVEGELRARFVRALAHDLRSPLAAIRAGAERLTHGGEDQRERVGAVVERSVDRVDGMIRDLLDAERVRAGRALTLRTERCDLGALITNVASATNLSAAGRIDVDVVESPACEVDPRAVARIVENLVTNALKYGEEQRPVTVRLRALGDCARIEVHNWGNPIPESELASLFESFERSHRSQDRVGWGIGLTLVRGLAEAHGGRVEVESTVDRGTTFSVALPRCSRPRAEVERRS